MPFSKKIDAYEKNDSYVSMLALSLTSIDPLRISVLSSLPSSYCRFGLSLPYISLHIMLEASMI